MKEQFPPIPENLRRHEKPPKKARAVVQLPERLADGTVIADQSIEQLVTLRDNIMKLLADVPRIELELRAIRATIRKKA